MFDRFGVDDVRCRIGPTAISRPCLFSRSAGVQSPRLEFDVRKEEARADLRCLAAGLVADDRATLKRSSSRSSLSTKAVGQTKAESALRKNLLNVRLGDAVGDGVEFHQGIDPAAFFMERGECAAFKLEAAGHGDGHGVHELVVDQDFVVKVGPVERPVDPT